MPHRTWQFFVFPVLFVLSESSERLAKDMQPILDLYSLININETYTPLMRSIAYTFPPSAGSTCLSISGDQSLFSEKFHQAAAEGGGIPPIVILDRRNRFKCKYYLVAVEHTEGLRSVLRKIPLSPTNRIWCLVNQGTLDDLQVAFQGTQSDFGDANVIIFSFGEYERALRIEQPERIFEKIQIPERGSWPFITNHIRAFSGMKIRYTTADCDLHMSFENEKRRGKWGLDWKIFEEITKGMNLTPEYVELPPGGGDVYGTFENGTWKGGMLGNIASRKADVGFCGIYLDISKFRGSMEMGNPIRGVCVKYAVRRPKPDVEDSWTVVYASFSPPVHLGVCISSILFATIIHFVATSKKVVGMIPPGYGTFGDSVTVTWGLLLQGYCTRISRMGTLRRFVFLWTLFSLVFSCSFSSHLVSNFTRPPFTPKPQNVEDLVNMGYASPLMMNFPMEFVLNIEDPYTQKWLDRNYDVEKWDNLVEILRTDDKTAVLGQIFDTRPYFLPYTPKAVPNEVLDLYETMDSCISYVYEAFAFRRGSPFRVPINEYVMNLARFGLLKKYNDDILTQVALDSPSVKFVLQKSSSVSVLRPLSIFHLKGVFVALIVGHALALLAFLGELVFHCFQVTSTANNGIHGEISTVEFTTMAEFIN